jgi:hypothetical protein
MNIQKAIPYQEPLAMRLRLLDQIRSFRHEIGDGLNDDEITRLIRRASLDEDSEFEFLSYSSGFVTLCSREKCIGRRISNEMWVSPKRMECAVNIAAKYGLEVYEPLNVDNTFTVFGGSQTRQRHFEFAFRQETIAIAHSVYIKVLLYMPKSLMLRHKTELNQVFSSSALLADLAQLYTESVG